MAAPVISWYINLGTEGTPVWTEITDSRYIYLTGPDSTSSAVDGISTPRTSSYKWADELWIGESPYANASQCNVYKKPTDVTQNGKILKITFADNPTLSAPKLTAYDNSSMNSIAKEIFSGTDVTNNTSFLKGIETTVSDPSQSWCNASTSVENGSTTNELKGDTNYVQCASTASADESKYFALACSVPSDMTAEDNTFVYAIVYTYV